MSIIKSIIVFVLRILLIWLLFDASWTSFCFLCWWLWRLVRHGVYVVVVFFLRYHLQALRHLCVLAAEPRLLVPVDVDTLKPCYALLDVTYKVLHINILYIFSVK